MFGKKKRVKEAFDAGKIATLDDTKYEIKLDGVVPPEYAKAINDRKETLEQIDKAFEEKDEITDQFLEEQQDDHTDTMVESLESSKEDGWGADVEKILDPAMNRAEKLTYEVRNTVRGVMTGARNVSQLADVVTDLADDFNRAAEQLEDDVEELQESANNMDLHKRAAAIAADIENFVDDLNKTNWEDFTTFTDIDTLNKAIEALQGFATAYGYIMDNGNVFESVEDIKKDYKKLEAKLASEGKDIAKEKLEGPLHDLAMKYVEASMKDLKECSEVELKEARTRETIPEEDKLYSEDDKWLQVYDDLSAEVQNEGPGYEVNKQVKGIPPRKRYFGPYVGPGDYDLTVYARTEDDLKWAKKIADHYGVKFEKHKDNNKKTNGYYPWVGVLRDIQ